MATARCWDCRLPDPYNGAGDGIGSCECPRCEDCGARPLRCDCPRLEEWELEMEDEPDARP